MIPPRQIDPHCDMCIEPPQEAIEAGRRLKTYYKDRDFPAAYSDGGHSPTMDEKILMDWFIETFLGDEEIE